MDQTQIRLVDRGGTIVARVTPGASFCYIGTRSSGAEFVEGGVLKSLRPNGAVDTIMSAPGLCGPLPGTGTVSGDLISPDGRQRLWAEYQQAGSQFHSTLHLTDASGADRAITTLDAEWKIVTPYLWDGGGALVQYEQEGIGGYAPLGYGATGPVYLLDPGSGTLTQIWQGPFGFYDRAADGSIAYLSSAGGGGLTLHVDRPGGPVVTAPLDPTMFQFAGAISFKPGPNATFLAMAGARDTATTSPSTKFNTYLVDLNQGGAISQVGPDGSMPAGGEWMWLADGSVIEYDRNPVTWAPGAAYFVSPSGTVTQLPHGIPAGVLTG